MENLLPKPREMDFNVPNSADVKNGSKTWSFTWLQWWGEGKTEEEKYSVLLFLNGEQGRGLFNAMTWERVIQQMKMALQWDSSLRIWKTTAYQRRTY